MPWWGWLLTGMGIVAVPFLALAGYYIHLLAHMFDMF